MGAIRELLGGMPNTVRGEIIELPRREKFEDFLEDCINTERNLNEHDTRRAQLVEQRKHAQRRMADFMKRNCRNAGFDPHDIDALASDYEKEIARQGEDPTEPEYEFED